MCAWFGCFIMKLLGEWDGFQQSSESFVLCKHSPRDPHTQSNLRPLGTKSDDCLWFRVWSGKDRSLLWLHSSSSTEGNAVYTHNKISWKACTNITELNGFTRILFNIKSIFGSFFVKSVYRNLHMYIVM